MHQIIFIRHEKSLNEEYISMDSERHLAPRGYEDAALTAAWCVREKLQPELILSSPAIRAFSTALIVANRCGYPQDNIQLVSGIYEADSRKLLYILREIADKYYRVMLFGHNPGFTDIVNTLCGQVLNHLPTSAVAVVDFDIESWSDLDHGKGKLVEVYSNHKEIG